MIRQNSSSSAPPLVPSSPEDLLRLDFPPKSPHFAPILSALLFDHPSFLHVSHDNFYQPASIFFSAPSPTSPLASAGFSAIKDFLAPDKVKKQEFSMIALKLEEDSQLALLPRIFSMVDSIAASAGGNSKILASGTAAYQILIPRTAKAVIIQNIAGLRMTEIDTSLKLDSSGSSISPSSGASLGRSFSPAPPAPSLASNYSMLSGEDIGTAPEAQSRESLKLVHANSDPLNLATASSPAPRHSYGVLKPEDFDAQSPTRAFAYSALNAESFDSTQSSASNLAPASPPALASNYSFFPDEPLESASPVSSDFLDGLSIEESPYYHPTLTDRSVVERILSSKPVHSYLFRPCGDPRERLPDQPWPNPNLFVLSFGGHGKIGNLKVWRLPGFGLTQFKDKSGVEKSIRNLIKSVLGENANGLDAKQLAAP